MGVSGESSKGVLGWLDDDGSAFSDTSASFERGAESFGAVDGWFDRSSSVR